MYLVSNAFEGRQGTPLLGMERYILQDEDLRTLFDQSVNDLPRVIVAGAPQVAHGSMSRSNSHGGFDNDPDTLNSVLFRILGKEPERRFTTRDLQY